MEDSSQTNDPAGPEDLPEVQSRSGRNVRLIILVGLVLVFLGGWVANYLLVSGPVARELDSDPRNSAYSLHAHYRYFVDPSTLVLNLSEVENAAPVDLFRAVFQSAKAMHSSGRRFDRVILARSGKPVFMITGEDFESMGSEFDQGQNPVYLIRTLPEKLYRPDGEPAFGRWEGGWLGVFGKQMNDANAAARQWAFPD